MSENQNPAPDATPQSPGQQPELGYEQAREELAEVVRKLESGGVPLADSMALWERGEKLAAICQQWLDGAKAKIDAARQAAG
ncbi:exodeoxyribonuclease VII small subunit [Luteococcus sp. H138]|uniref:exodeoxyribonuclease VII small subunit n=1 Tax=unclassified Luteococcus TaxID=2639923 RepID=UPI00313AA720